MICWKNTQVHNIKNIMSGTDKCMVVVQDHCRLCVSVTQDFPLNLNTICGYRKLSRSLLINVVFLLDNRHCVNEAILCVLKDTSTYEGHEMCMRSSQHRCLLQFCFVSRWQYQTTQQMGCVFWQNVKRAKRNICKEAHSHFIWNMCVYLCVCVYPCIPMCGCDSSSVFTMSVYIHVCVCVCQGVCVHTHAHGVYWEQLSLCDQLIKRCMLGWSLVLSPSVVSDLGSAHCPFSSCLNSTMWNFNMQIFRAKKKFYNIWF